MLVDKTVRQLLDAFAAPTPTPGGGSASAVAGAMAASLLAMVAAMPKTRNGTPEDRAALDAAHPKLVALKELFTDLVDRDAASYDAVVAAYRLPKSTDEEKAVRKQAIAAAMRGATDVPLETARAAVALVPLGRIVAAHGNPNAKSDAGVALSMAMTAYAGGRANVEINLDGVGDEAYVSGVRAALEEMMVAAGPELVRAYEAMGWKGHRPHSA
jgi:formiminotetrahydrofolate cyclodeaminase